MKYQINFFHVRIEKNYNSNAYITVITHKIIEKNNTAVQNFTNKGPIAFFYQFQKRKHQLCVL